ncbi:MAG: putative flagellar protein FliJ [Candidatus Campylobacter infans]|nr:MAG: putative flagellar protein FliJ [Candidatus Campylobacter infans]
MKTKFTPVVKLRQNKLDEIELALNKARAYEITLKSQLERTRMLLASKPFPKSGDFASLQIALSSQALLTKQIDELKQKITQIAKQILNLQNAHKTAYIELEKVKYLENSQIKEILKERAKIASKNLDEIATQRFYALNKVDA